MLLELSAELLLNVPIEHGRRSASKKRMTAQSAGQAYFRSRSATTHADDVEDDDDDDDYDEIEDVDDNANGNRADEIEDEIEDDIEDDSSVRKV